jgi:hypothetical protein
MALPMNYTTELDLFMDRVKSLMRQVDRKKLWMGVATYNQTGRDAALKILQMRTLGLSDYVLFSYDSAQAYPELVTLLK